MRRFFFETRSLGAGLVLLVAGVVSLAGCGGEPTGEDAFSQKFEAPAGAKEAGPMPDPVAERRADIEKSRATPPPGKAGGKKR